MTCETARALIHGYADGELDLERSLEIEAHIADCAVCTAALGEIRVLRSALRSGGVTFNAPDALRAKIRGAIGDAKRAPSTSRRDSTMRTASTLRLSYRLSGAIAAAAVLMIIVILGGLHRFDSSGDDLIGSEIVASHVRSLMADHLADVISTNQHTVKPWFDGKIDFAPTVEDFAAQGFPLTGGRLDYADGRPVAALVYRRNKHIINLFTWPIHDASESALRTEQRQGYNIVHWNKGGMAYWTVSDVNGAELMNFATLVRNGATPATPPSD
jgi:anti-sigma factor RsiW